MKCKGCGADIKFIKTKSGKFIPCDMKPVRITKLGESKYMFVLSDGTIVRGFSDPEGWAIGYVPHWSTCPAASDFKRKK